MTMIAKGSNPEIVLPAPAAARRCELCGVILGNARRVHFTKATDTKPCEGSWK